MKKLTVVTDAWHPQVNGVVTVFDRIIPLLKQRGYEISLIEPAQFPHTIAMPLYPEIRLALFAKSRVRALLKEQNPDMIHIATEGPLGLAARRYCIKHKIPFTTSYHTHFQLYLTKYFFTAIHPLVNGFLRWFHDAATATMTATPSMCQTLKDIGIKHVKLWPLGVDLELFSYSENPDLPALAKPVFAYFSRLAKEKSPEEFFKLDLPGTKLVIGDGPMRAALEKKYGSTATFVGYKRGKELVQWLSMADVMIFPSRTETFGLVVVESLACGVPVAAHDVMGPRDIITEGVDGYLGEDLAEAANKCLALSPRECRAKAEEYSWERSAEAFVQNLAFRT
jgi:glycosyltransferase involved in cell wall biosynthesis